ncbi:hypothetical protein Golomagni_00961 [Golovinomyces magnicellulatus]|nr:hypothetical protein Golomagni_00961 [Golovinomyces magnicellulatus]
MVGRDSEDQNGSSLNRHRNHDTQRHGYATTFEPQGIRKTRLNPNTPRNSSWNNRSLNQAGTSASSSGSGSGSGTSTGTRRRIPIACGRCRKRKIRCSGDAGNGKQCTSCKRAGADQCEFLRVSSQRTTMKSELVPPVDFESIANMRNVVPCAPTQTYQIHNSLPIDSYTFRGNMVPSCNVRTLPVFDMDIGYDISGQGLDYQLSHSAPTYATLPTEPLSSNCPSSNMRNWNSNIAHSYARNAGYSNLTDTSVYGNQVSLPGYLSPRCTVIDQKSVPFCGLPLFPSTSLLNSVGVENNRQIPVRLADRPVPTPSILRSIDQYSGPSAQGGFELDAGYSYPSNIRVTDIGGISESSSFNASYLSRSNNDQLQPPHSISYESQNLPMGSHGTNNYTLPSTETNVLMDASESTYGPSSSHGSNRHCFNDDHSTHHMDGPLSPLSNTCMENQAYISLSSEEVEKYSSPPVDISSLTQNSTGYPTPGSMHNSFSSPPK